jgi:hypothetical protein
MISLIHALGKHLVRTDVTGLEFWFWTFVYNLLILGYCRLLLGICSLQWRSPPVVYTDNYSDRIIWHTIRVGLLKVFCIGILRTKLNSHKLICKSRNFEVFSAILSHVCDRSSSAENIKRITELNSVARVRELTIPTEPPPLVGEITANFCG